MCITLRFKDFLQSDLNACVALILESVVIATNVFRNMQYFIAERPLYDQSHSC